MSGYESKKLKLVVGMGSLGLFLLACLAYNLGGAKQQAKDIVIHEHLMEAVKAAKNSLDSCKLDLEKPEGVGPDFFRSQIMELEVSLTHLRANRDIEDDKKVECTTERYNLAESKETAGEKENYVLAEKAISAQIKELNDIITHIRDEKVANRTSLRLKIRVFRQENKLLHALLMKKLANQEEEEKRLDEIKHKHIEASRELAIGERHGDEEEHPSIGRKKTTGLVKSVESINDEQRGEIFKKYSDEDPEYEEEAQETKVALRKRRRMEKLRLQEESGQEDTVAEQQRASIEEAKQVASDEDDVPMPPRKRARLEARRRAMAEKEARERGEEAAETPQRRVRGRGMN